MNKSNTSKLCNTHYFANNREERLVKVAFALRRSKSSVMLFLEINSNQCQISFQLWWVQKKINRLLRCLRTVADAKWPLVCRQYIKIILSHGNCCFLIQISLVDQWSNQQWFNIDLVYNLAPNSRRANILTNYDIVYWVIYVTRRLGELIFD